MAEPGAVAREIDVLEQIQAEFAGVASRNDEQRRHDLIQLRRRLSTQIAATGQVAEALIASRDDPDLLQTYRLKFSKMRAAAAMHQADWPAVSLGEREDEYHSSALKVREANQEFVAWMRGTLLRMY